MSLSAGYREQPAGPRCKRGIWSKTLALRGHQSEELNFHLEQTTIAFDREYRVMAGAPGTRQHHLYRRERDGTDGNRDD